MIMKYMGSKNRIAKYILPIILKNRKPGQWYVEPFVGGANMIDKVNGNRFGIDNNPYLISCLELIRDKVKKLPKNNMDTNSEMYLKIKSKELYYGDAIFGYFGFALSYGGKWFGGWCRDKKSKRDYVSEAYRNAVKQSPKLKGIIFQCAEYYNFNMPDNSIIYCDPPYAGCTGYKNKFDHDLFWNWCRNKAKQNHIIFISEYSAPADFDCVWVKEIVSSLTKNTGNKKGLEKLFTIKVKNKKL